MLNRNSPSAAATRAETVNEDPLLGNHVDVVEQVPVQGSPALQANGQPWRYRLQVTHAGNLTNAPQAFSLVVSAGSVEVSRDLATGVVTLREAVQGNGDCLILCRGPDLGGVPGSGNLQYSTDGVVFSEDLDTATAAVESLAVNTINRINIRLLGGDDQLMLDYASGNLLGPTRAGLQVDFDGGMGADRFVDVRSGTAPVTLNGNSLNASITGGGRTDTLTNIERVQLAGDAQDNNLSAAGVADAANPIQVSFIGLGGNDTLVGGIGNDTLSGGAGNDSYRFDADNPSGSDSVNDSGGGTDTLDFSETASVPLTLSLANSTAQSLGANLTITLSADNTIENIFGGAMGDSFAGNALPNSLVGGAGNDTLDAGDGKDTVDGGAGTDRLVHMEDGTQTLSNVSLKVKGGVVTIVSIEEASLSGGAMKDTIKAQKFTLGPVTLDGGAGSDVLTGTDQADVLTGGSDDAMDLKDTINGLAGNNTLQGGAGDDKLTGAEHNDSLFGQSGDDFLKADGGLDTLNGGPGIDRLDCGKNDGVNDQFDPDPADVLKNCP